MPPPDLSQVLQALTQREPIFHRPEFGTTRAGFERMTTPDFCEIGASGRIYTRAQVLDILERRHAAPHADIWHASGFQCRQLSAGVYLLTYTLLQDNTRKTRRTTIWQNTPDGWKIVFHQGTILENTPAFSES